MFKVSIKQMKALMTAFLLVSLIAVLGFMGNSFMSAEAADTIELATEYCDNAADSISSLLEEGEDEEAEALDTNGGRVIIQTINGLGA